MVRKSAKAAKGPLAVLIHIPKTAGSMVNEVLLRQGQRGQDHVEAWLAEPEEFRGSVKELDWVSGHVPRAEMEVLLRQITDRPLRFFSVVRDPVSQIRSHYNWLIEIFHRGPEFYDTHPKIIKVISENIRGTDNTDADKVCAQLMHWTGLFLNQQTRVLFGEEGFGFDAATMTARLRSDFEFVVREEGLGRLIARMSGQEPPALPRVNESASRFNPGIFRSPKVLEFLEANHSSDFRLYRAVKALTYAPDTV